MSRPLAIALVVIGGCGRLGYDPSPSAGLTGPDAGSRLGRGVLCRIDTGTGDLKLTVFRVLNRTAGPVELPVGGANGFSPPPIDRGQPRSYPPGPTLFALLHHDVELVWRVDLGTATSGQTVAACTLADEGGRAVAVLDDGERVPVAAAR